MGAGHAYGLGRDRHGEGEGITAVKPGLGVACGINPHTLHVGLGGRLVLSMDELKGGEGNEREDEAGELRKTHSSSCAMSGKRGKKRIGEN